MSHCQFEMDLTHLELIVPLLVTGSPLALSYWRRRITALSWHKSTVPGAARRVTRLLVLLDEVERASTSSHPAA